MMLSCTFFFWVSMLYVLTEHLAVSLNPVENVWTFGQNWNNKLCQTCIFVLEMFKTYSKFVVNIHRMLWECSIWIWSCHLRETERSKIVPTPTATIHNPHLFYCKTRQRGLVNVSVPSLQRTPIFKPQSLPIDNYH